MLTPRFYFNDWMVIDEKNLNELQYWFCPQISKQNARKCRVGIFLAANPAMTRGGDVSRKHLWTSSAGRQTRQQGKAVPRWDFLSCLMSVQAAVTNPVHLPSL